MSTDNVLMEIDDGIATLTLNRAAQLNALDEPTRLALLSALIKANNSQEVKAIILTGAGRGFCVGQDLSAGHELDDCHDCVGRTYNPVIAQLEVMEKPVIAAVNGPAVGAGMGFALGCDLVLMADDSFFSCAFGKVGLIPDSGATYFLSRTVGHYRAFEIAISGRRIMPPEALLLGLANQVVVPQKLMEESRALASRLAALSPKALILTKQLLRRAMQAPLPDALAAEALAQGVCGATAEHVQLRGAFLAKAAR